MANHNGSTQVRSNEFARAATRAGHQIGDAAGRARKSVVAWDESLEERMRENPMLVLGIAVGVGYVLGRLFSRFR